ncbi:MAG: membrane integrity-associated transporter subunit PqiC [Desulfuromusa sp.]|nr:membrane integrity-associated transporter subunit PqiC [Desulfuromusa sp.]
MRYFLIFLLLLCSSCIQLLGDPQPTRDYLLESLPEGTEVYSAKTLTIDIQLSGFPTYLDRPQVIARNNDNTIEYSDLDRWAEPLQENIPQTLRENLRILLPGANISISPWEDSTTDTIKIKVTVNKFSGKLGNHTDIKIGWTLDVGTGEIRQGHFSDRQPVGETYQDLVASLNSGINNFSRDLAKNLTKE